MLCQCDISVGIVIDERIPRVAPPKMRRTESRTLRSVSGPRVYHAGDTVRLTVVVRIVICPGESRLAVCQQQQLD